MPARYFAPFGLLADAAAPDPAAVVQAVLARLWRVRGCIAAAPVESYPSALSLQPPNESQCAAVPAAPSRARAQPSGAGMECDAQVFEAADCLQRLARKAECRPLRRIHRRLLCALPAEQYELLPAPLAAAHIWLPATPTGVYGGVWNVVSLAAVAAMDHGERRMYAEMGLGTGYE
ncbi:hypothetical protein ACK3TF_000856 [Chlorella vulgaris]